MTKTHRKLHKIFWFSATPLMLVVFFWLQPASENERMPPQQIPEGSDVGVFDTGAVTGKLK